jgi:hypothetical protein
MQETRGAKLKRENAKLERERERERERIKRDFFSRNWFSSNQEVLEGGKRKEERKWKKQIREKRS